MKSVLKWGGIGLLALAAPLLVPVPPLKDTRSAQDLADTDSHFIRVNGLRVHYKIAGQGEPLIVLLHGFGASAYSWERVLPRLAEHGTVVAYDRPGFGLTERPRRGAWRGESPYGPLGNLRLLLGLIEALGSRQAVLVGHSAGGTLALQAALAAPGTVRGLVAVDAAVYQPIGGPAWLRALLRLPQVDHLGPLLVRAVHRRAVDLIHRAWHDPARVTPEIVAGYERPFRAHDWDRALWEVARAARPPGLDRRLGALRQPTLVISGADDRVVPAASSARLAGAIPGAELVVIPKCGHIPAEEAPEAFLAAVTPFLTALG